MFLTSGKQDIFPVGHSCCGCGVISDLVNLLHVDNINSGKGLSGIRSNQTFLFILSHGYEYFPGLY